MEKLEGSSASDSELDLGPSPLQLHSPCSVCSSTESSGYEECLIVAPELQGLPAFAAHVRSGCRMRAVLMAAFGEMTLTKSRQERLAAIRPPARCREVERRWWSS